MPKFLTALIVLALLSGCAQSTATSNPPADQPARPAGKPVLSGTLPATWTPVPTTTPQPWRSLTPPSFADQPSATVAPSLGSAYLWGVEALLPQGSTVLDERSWQIPAPAGWAAFWLLPFQPAEGAPGALDLALIGLPSAPGGAWDRKTLILLWTWSAGQPGKPLWSEVRALPLVSTVDSGSAAGFLGQDASGAWSLVPLALEGERIVSVALPVSEPEEVFLARSPLEDGGASHYFVRDGSGEGRLRVFDRAGRQVGALDRAPGRTFTIQLGAPAVALDGRGPRLIVLAWNSTTGRAIQLLSFENGQVALAAEPGLDDQLLEIDGDGLRELVSPDEQVRRWAGSEFVPPADLPRSGAPEPVALADWSALPPLPADLYLRGADGAWTVWPASGGALAPAPGDPPLLRPCSTPADPCRSPDGRYELAAVVEVLPTPTPTATSTPNPTETADSTKQTGLPATVTADVTAGPEVTPTAPPARVRVYAGVRSLGSGAVATVQGTLTEEGQNNFAWSADGRLLLARAGVTGGLLWVNPTTGRTTPLMEIARCGLARLPCPQLSTGMGASDPIFFTNGDVGFAVQSTMAGQYPPPGIYRRSSDGRLLPLADLGLLDPMCVVTQAGYGFGQVIWSAGGAAFLYFDPPNCPNPRVLLGLGDGSALWDLSGLPGTITGLRFGASVP